MPEPETNTTGVEEDRVNDGLREIWRAQGRNGDGILYEVVYPAENRETTQQTVFEAEYPLGSSDRRRIIFPSVNIRSDGYFAEDTFEKFWHSVGKEEEEKVVINKITEIE